MKKLWNKLMSVLPIIWGGLICALITVALITGAILVFELLLKVVGVM